MAGEPLVSETTQVDTLLCPIQHKLDAAPFMPSIKSTALTTSSNSFQPDFANASYSSAIETDVEADYAGGSSSEIDMSDEGQLRSFEPAYKRKEKTELCKNW